MDRRFGPASFFVAGLIVGAAGYALLGPYRAAIHPDVQTVLLALLGAVIAASAAGAGVLAGARIAAGEAAAGRTEERRARFHDQTRVLAAELLRESSLHEQQVADEVAWRSGPENAPWDLARKPVVGPTEPVAVAAYELRVTSEQRATANQARQVYMATVALDAFAFTPATDLVDAQHARQLDQAKVTDFTNHRAALHGARRAFIRLVREELGRQPFDDEWDQ